MKLTLKLKEGITHILCSHHCYWRCGMFTNRSIFVDALGHNKGICTVCGKPGGRIQLRRKL